MNNETDSYIEGLSRSQTFLLPKTIEEYVQADNPVRFIDAYVNTLDMEKLGFTHSKPQDLECKTNLEAIAILGSVALKDFLVLHEENSDFPSIEFEYELPHK